MMFRPLSVRMRLTLWYLAALTLIISAFSVGIYLFTRAEFLGQLQTQLDAEVAAVARMLRDEPNELSELEEHASVLVFQVTDGDSVLYRTAGWRRGQFLASPSQRTNSVVPQSFTSSAGERHRIATRAVRLEDHDYKIFVAKPEEPVWRSLRSLRVALLAAFPVAFAAAFVGGYFLAGRFLAPVGAMAEKAKGITAERLSERLPVENPDDEFGQLATVFNEMLVRLENAFERLRRFTSDVSHELRTPLTSIKSVGEVGLREQRDPAAYRDIIGSMLEETDRLARLVDGLLTLTRADAAASLPNREHLDLAALTKEVVHFLHVLVEEKQQTLRVDIREEVQVEADRWMLRQAIINIIDNAIKYSPSNAAIQIVVGRAEQNGAIVEVIDEGPGISEEHRAKVFERFYRIDRNRSSQTGGTGLGLAIARWAVEANGGKIELETEQDKGSTFRIVLPNRGDSK
ncbi:MAG: heavy metal sensor histidine kinase [Planctomycetes bacterium]|nr:heavy metal sensor histidine kinase [Planctomycetota bacterium]